MFMRRARSGYCGGTLSLIFLVETWSWSAWACAAAIVIRLSSRTRPLKKNVALEHWCHCCRNLVILNQMCILYVPSKPIILLCDDIDDIGSSRVDVTSRKSTC